MSIKFNLLLVTMCLVSTAAAASEVCRDEYGVMYCSDGEVSSIHYLGKTSLAGTRVTGLVKVIGNVDANAADIGAMDIIGNIDATQITVHNALEAVGNVRSNQSRYQSETKITGDLKGGNNQFTGKTTVIGSAILNHDTFTQDAIFTGKLHSEAAAFSSSVRIDSCLAEFYQTSSGQLTMSFQPHCPSNIQKIYLNDKSQIKGDVVFQGNNGKVYLSKDSMLNGRVIGGAIVRE